MPGPNRTSGDEAVESVALQELKERIDAGEDMFVLDVRSESDFEEWRLDGAVEVGWPSSSGRA